MNDQLSYSTEELDVLAQSKFNNSINIIRHAYVDIAEDLVAGALLGQILYWFEPNQHGKRKVRIFKEGHYWLAKGRDDWFDEIRISPKQYDRAAKILEKKNLILRKRFKFNGSPTVHVRPIYENINAAINEWMDNIKEQIKKQNEEDAKVLDITSFSPKGKIDFTQR